MICVAVFSTICYFAVLTDGANILGFLPFFGSSHNSVTLPLFEELARRGHNVTVVGFLKPRNAPNNYRSVLLKPLPEFGTNGFESAEKFKNSNFLTTMSLMINMVKLYDRIIEQNDVLKLLKDGKYDVVIVEYFESDLFPAIASTLNIPMILFHTCEPFPWHRAALGDPSEPSRIPGVFSKLSNVMDFYDRLRNTMETLTILMYYHAVVLPEAQRTAEKYLGPLPPLQQLTKKASLYLTNSHFSFYGPKPIHPFTVEVGGIHILPSKPLPKDLNELVNNSSHGVIYFSMGSVLKGSSMSSEKRDAIVNVLSEVKQTVLWKWEEKLPHMPSNVYASAWFPQRDILAHSNVVLFISHCGLLGAHEAITEAIPVICLPMFGDQHRNAQTLTKKGMGVSLDYASLDEARLREAISKVLGDRSFKENAKKLSEAFLDRPASALETAVYWTEYVLRHKGAHQLISSSRFMTWWQYHNVDVLGALFLVASTLLFVLYKILKWFLLLVLRKTKEQKLKTS